MFTWTSNIRLFPLKAKAMIPTAFRTSKNLVAWLPIRTGLYETFGSLSLVTDTIQIVVQYPKAAIAPRSEMPAMEFRLGSWDRIIAAHANTKYHSTTVSVSGLHPEEAHATWKNILDVDAPIMIQATHVPNDKLMIGNRVKIFPNLSPAGHYIVSNI